MASIAPLLSFLPIEQLFPGLDKQIVIGALTSIPQITDLVTTFINFDIPLTAVVK